MATDNPYIGREPAKVKHFLLGQYLEDLAYKILQRYDTLTFVDAFSGPWQTQTDEFKDTSFRIALDILGRVQKSLRAQGRPANINCVFVEKNSRSFAKLSEIVGPFHKPNKGFSVRALHGEFEERVADIEEVTGRSFQLLFIDPKGWKGYAYGRTGELVGHSPGEVIINFMYDHFNRFRNLDDPKQEELRVGLLGKNWRSQFDALINADEEISIDGALTHLFRERLREVGGFQYVVTTRIDRATKDRPQYFLVYGTRHPKGLEVYRANEAKALKIQVGERSLAKSREIEERKGIGDLFAESVRGQSHEDFVETEAKNARAFICNEIRRPEIRMTYRDIWTRVLERFVLTKTVVNGLIRSLAREGAVEETWKCHGSRVTTPRDNDIIIRR